MRLVDKFSGQPLSHNPSAGGGGILQAQVNGQWGYVCDDYFDELAAEVACRTIFPTLPTSQATVAHCNGVIPGGCHDQLHVGRTVAGDTGNTCGFTLDNLHCSNGAATSVNDATSCTSVGREQENCYGTEAVWLQCGAVAGTTCPAPPPIQGLRLSGGLTSGLLEATTDGTHWGPVCDDYFDLNDHQVEVVCRQLGYLDANGAQTGTGHTSWTRTEGAGGIDSAHMMDGAQGRDRSNSDPGWGR